MVEKILGLFFEKRTKQKGCFITNFNIRAFHG